MKRLDDLMEPKPLQAGRIRQAAGQVPAHGFIVGSGHGIHIERDALCWAFIKGRMA
jgi:hypothetical protein